MVGIKGYVYVLTGMAVEKRVLLISPDFFNYSQIIKSAMEKKGYIVDWFSDRNGVSFMKKALLRVKKSALKSSIDKYLKKIRKFAANYDYEYVVVVNGEVLTAEFVESLKKDHADAEFVLYMWDSLKNFSDSEKLLPCFDKCFSFDKNDCETHEALEFLPLFYYLDDGYTDFVNAEKVYDYAFIGTVKKGKFGEIKKITDNLDERYDKSFKYLYLQSRLVYLYYKFKYRQEFKDAKMSMFRYKRLSTKRCNEIGLRAKIIVDVPMKDQNGLTIRTFEILSRGQKLITSNANIRDYDFFDSDQVYVYDGNEIDFSAEFFEDRLCEENTEIKKYHIDNWLTALMA